MGVIATGQEVDLPRRLHLLRYELRRSPVQDAKHPAYGGYMIVDTQQHLVVAGHEPFAFSLDLDGVADWLRTTEMKHTSQTSNALAGLTVSVALSSPLDGKRQAHGLTESGSSSCSKWKQ